MHANVEFAQKVALAYGAVCKPLCRELGLTRQPVAGDRRKTALACTPRAQEVIRRGRQLQTAFFDSLFRGMEPPLRTAFIDAMQIIDSNLDQLLREER